MPTAVMQTKNAQKPPVTLTLKFNMVLDVVKVHVIQNFIKLSAAAHELSC